MLLLSIDKFFLPEILIAILLLSASLSISRKVELFLSPWKTRRHPGLNSQSLSALISSDSDIIQFWFSAVQYLKISEQRWFNSEERWKPEISELEISADQRWISAVFFLKQSWTALVFSETELNILELWFFQFSSSPDFFCNSSPEKLR